MEMLNLDRSQKFAKIGQGGCRFQLLTELAPFFRLYWCIHHTFNLLNTAVFLREDDSIDRINTKTRLRFENYSHPI